MSQTATTYRSLAAFAKDFPDAVDLIVGMEMSNAVDHFESQFKDFVISGTPMRPDVAKTNAAKSIRRFAATHGIEID